MTEPARRYGVSAAPWEVGVIVLFLLALVFAVVTRPSFWEFWERDHPPGSDDRPTQLTVTVANTFPHDPEAFTQGLELHDGLLYESTGLYGRSDVRVTDLRTGEVQQRVALPEEFFGEGLTVVGDRIWQLTWREQVALLRDRETLEELDRVAYTGEGWGLCYDEPRDRLVMSDGSATLTFRDPETFAPLDTLKVHRQGRPVEMLNELECVGDTVWANVWLTDEIVAISVADGRVVAQADLSGLLTKAERERADVLNGIADIPGRNTMLVTGKLWPTVFEIRLDDPSWPSPRGTGDQPPGPVHDQPLAVPAPRTPGAPAHRSGSGPPSASGAGGRSTAAHGSRAGRSLPSEQTCR